MKPRSFLRRLRRFSIKRPIDMHNQEEETEEQEPSLYNELEELVKLQRNEELKLMLEDTKPSDWVFENGNTLLHLAAKYDNVVLLKYLLDNGYDVEAKNSNSETVLLVALNNSQFEAVKILLDADANACIIDSSTGKTSLGILMTKNQERIIDVLPHFTDNLKRRNLDANTLIDFVLAANWPLQFVMTFNDVELSRKFLQREPRRNHRTGMMCAIENRDSEHIQLILQYGNDDGKSVFYDKLSDFFKKYQIDSWQFLIQNLSHYDGIIEASLELFDFMFMSATTEYLQVLLDNGIHVKIKQKFGIDMLTCIFGNIKVDAVEFRLRNQIFLEDFNVNARGMERQTALHYAVKENLMPNIRFLLNSGADVNAKNDQGQTPLFECMHWNNTGQLLLEHGADVQVVDNEGVTIFESAQKKNPVLLDFLVAQLAIDYVRGKSIEQIVKNQIDSNNECRRTFQICCQQLRLLKAYEISNSITLFAVLTTKFETPYRFTCDHNTIFLLEEYKDQHGLHLFYYKTMKEKMIKISNLYHFTCDVSDIISEGTGKFVDFDHLVVKRISDYFTQRDIQEYICNIGYYV